MEKVIPLLKNFRMQAQPQAKMEIEEEIGTEQEPLGEEVQVDKPALEIEEKVEDQEEAQVE